MNRKLICVIFVLLFIFSNITANHCIAAASSASARAYVTNSGSNNVSVIDTNTNSVVATIPVGQWPIGVAASPDGTRVYVTNDTYNGTTSGSGTVSVIDTGTNSVIATITMRHWPWGVAVSPDGRRVYVANESYYYYDNTISVIDTSTNSIIAEIPVGNWSSLNWPYGVAVSPDGTRVFVASYNSTVSVINTSTNSVVATIPAGPNLYGVAVSPDGTRVFVTNSFNSGTVSVIDTGTNSVVATIPVGQNPYGVAVSPDGTRVFVANWSYNGTVSVINTSTNSVVATIPAGQNPWGVAVSPDGSRVYVANESYNGTVSVIDTSTNSVVATVPVGVYPYGVAVSPATPAALIIKQPAVNSSYPLVQNDYVSTNNVTYEADTSSSYSGQVTWSTLLEYATSGGRGAFQATDSFTSQTNTTTTRTYSSEGGRLTINASALLSNGKTVSAAPVQYAYIVGSPIPNAEITQRLVKLYKGATPNLLTGIAMVESTYRQFAQKVLYGFNGRWPNESYDGGSHIGLMMVPTTPTDAWDWLTNTQDGASMFREKISIAKALERKIRKTYKGLPRLTDTQIENMAVVLYGPAGHSRNLNMQYYIPQVSGNTVQWVVNTANNAVGVQYANNVRISVYNKNRGESMRQFKIITILFALIISVTASTVFADSLLDTARTTDWTVQNISTLNQIFPDKSAVNAFLYPLVENADIFPPIVGEYALVDLNNNGTIQLVTTLDNNGRAFFTSILIVRKVENQFKTSELWTAPVSIEDLGSRIVDLHKDGVKEILVPRALAPYAGGTTPIPIVSDVYQWDGERLVKVNAKFKDYFANTVLPRLEKKLTEVDKESYSDKALLKENYQKEIDEVNNILSQ